MLRLTKKTEYALLALRSLAREQPGSAAPSRALGLGGPVAAPLDVIEAAISLPPDLVTARAIAQRYQIPEMLLAKVLQRLKKSGIVVAAKGSGGGYRLARPLSEIPLITVLSLFDEHTNLVECQDDHGRCQQLESCDIKGPLSVLNAALMEPLRRMTVQDLFVPPRVAPKVISAEASRFTIVDAALLR
jgi:Rrf2 family nitric oxide-sensitive transcriptional repressor